MEGDDRVIATSQTFKVVIMIMIIMTMTSMMMMMMMMMMMRMMIMRTLKHFICKG